MARALLANLADAWKHNMGTSHQIAPRRTSLKRSHHTSPEATSHQTPSSNKPSWSAPGKGQRLGPEKGRSSQPIP